jgi:hypothetical protein
MIGFHILTMLHYREIRDEEGYADQVWKAEESAPRWFRDAAHVWTPDFDRFIAFWRNCGEIYGLFDDDRLLAMVYIEYRTLLVVNIHVSVIAKVPEGELERFFVSLMRKKAQEGVQVMTGWVLAKNRGLLRVARNAGFKPNGLKMTFGASNGRALEWIQVRA